MIVDVDCTADGAQTCQKMGVQGYPTIKYFLAGDKKGKDYQQGRDFDAMLAFTKKTLDVEKCDVKTKKACKPNEIALIEKFDGKTSADIAEELKKRSEELKTIKSDMKAAKLEHNTKVATWKKREAALNKGEAILKQLEQLRKISAMIGAEKKRIVSAVSQQTESIEFGDFGRVELTETQEQYDMYLEGMSYPSG